MPDDPAARLPSHDRIEVADAASLLAATDRQLDALAEDPRPTLRWYRTGRPAIVLGRGQRGLTLTAPTGVDVVRRPSGGGAVWLSPDVLSLDVALPSTHPWVHSDDLGAVFSRLGEVWRDALAALGVRGLLVHTGPSTTPRATDERSRLLAAVCYATVGRGEVLVQGRKLLGLSQRHRRHGTLVQCGLLRTWSPAVLLAALGADPDDPEVSGAAVGLAELLPAAPSDAAVLEAVETALARAGLAGHPRADLRA